MKRLGHILAFSFVAALIDPVPHRAQAAPSEDERALLPAMGDEADEIADVEGTCEAVDDLPDAPDEHEMAARGQRPHTQCAPVELGRYRRVYLPEKYVVLNLGNGLYFITNADPVCLTRGRTRPGAMSEDGLGREVCVGIISGLSFGAGAVLGGILDVPGGPGISGLFAFATSTAVGSVGTVSAVALCPRPVQLPPAPAIAHPTAEPPSVSVTSNPSGILDIPRPCPDPGCGCGAGCGCGCANGASCGCGCTHVGGEP